MHRCITTTNLALVNVVSLKTNDEDDIEAYYLKGIKANKHLGTHNK